MNEKKVYEIAIVGAGQLGARHLQSLGNLKLLSSITVVDTSEASLNRAREISGIHEAHYCRNISDIPADTDLAIIATTSDVRKDIFKYLIEEKNIKHFILEKVLFQHIDDYYEIEKLTKKLGIHAWVNCPRRMYESVKKLKTGLYGKTITGITVIGSNWGIGSNAVHFLDFISYLTDSSDYLLDASNIYELPEGSKRKGYKEFYGSLKGKFNDRDTAFELISYVGGNMPLFIQLTGPEFLISINQINQRIIISSKENNWVFSEDDFKIPYQSQLTSIAVEEILVTGKCDLTEYSGSMIHHVKLIKELLNKISGDAKMEIHTCSIT